MNLIKSKAFSRPVSHMHSKVFYQYDSFENVIFSSPLNIYQNGEYAFSYSSKLKSVFYCGFTMLYSLNNIFNNRSNIKIYISS